MQIPRAGDPCVTVQLGFPTAPEHLVSQSTSWSFEFPIGTTFVEVYACAAPEQPLGLLAAITSTPSALRTLSPLAQCSGLTWAQPCNECHALLIPHYLAALPPPQTWLRRQTQTHRLGCPLTQHTHTRTVAKVEGIAHMAPSRRCLRARVARAHGRAS